MTEKRIDTEPESSTVFDAARQMSQWRLFAIGVTVVLLAGTMVFFFQAATGYVAVYHLSFSDATPTDYSTVDGEEAVEITVENPANRKYEITELRVTGWVNDSAVNQDGRILIDDPIVVPAGGSATFTAELNVPEDRRSLYHDAESITFEGHLVAEFGSERNHIDIDRTEVQR